jgi:DNA repair photolyase
MPLNKSKGNMYPWVTHTHSHLGGECPHKCAYCYVDHPERPKRYQGPLRLIQEEFKVKYGTGKTIFVEHCNDLFCEDVLPSEIMAVLLHTLQYPENTYVYQTKNPRRYFDFIEYLPEFRILGTTIETNRPIPPEVSKAPAPLERMKAMVMLKERKFVTIEPVMDFDVNILAGWIARIRPEFLNLGADSKGHDLPEPTVEKIMQLVDKLQEYGIELREKHNLRRLKAK